MAIRVEHRIGVAAPAEVIWTLVFDVERWPTWNPLYTEARGKIAIGDTLQLTESLPGRRPRAIQPVVVDWEPSAQIVWRTGGLLSKTVRYIEIEALSETGCIFANGAFFHGMMGEQEAKGGRRALFGGYEQFGEAVKRLSEQAWREPAAAR